MSAYPTWAMFIGGKKIYVLCGKYISNTDILLYWVTGWGGGVVLSAPAVLKWKFSLAEPESCILINAAFGKLNDLLKNYEFSRQKCFLFA
jgi:hypothetical protein